ncbi:phosphatidylethanolamine-binding protein [Klebsiella pneumoniae]|uniref:Phosphatidylethanolamine-binding protein n=1 Tax=Klebsiella pneumoniae TaxID=573 RepID=A0A378AHF0_KLEPN|nr:phosphatidylethanolamine-binding protein [Klebsiella pneumoniae]
MKTGIRMAVAMVAAVSSGAMAAPFSVSSDDMRDGQPLASSTGLPVSAVPEAMSLRSCMEKRPGGYAQLRGHRPGSRCAYRQRLVALDGGQYRQQRLFAARWRGR